MHSSIECARPSLRTNASRECPQGGIRWTISISDDVSDEMEFTARGGGAVDAYDPLDIARAVLRQPAMMMTSAPSAVNPGEVTRARLDSFGECVFSMNSRATATTPGRSNTVAVRCGYVTPMRSGVGPDRPGQVRAFAFASRLVGQPSSGTETNGVCSPRGTCALQPHRTRRRYPPRTAGRTLVA